MKTNAISLCVIFEELFIQVVERANNVQYGLSASVWSTDVGKIHRVAHKLEVVPLQTLFIGIAYTGSCPQRVRLLRVPGYNEHFFYQKRTLLIWLLLITSRFLLIKLLVVSRTQCTHFFKTVLRSKN